MLVLLSFVSDLFLKKETLQVFLCGVACLCDPRCDFLERVMARSVGSPWRLWVITTTLLVMVHQIHASRYLDRLGVRSGRGVLAAADEVASALESEEASVAMKVEQDMVQQSQKDGAMEDEEKSTDPTFDIIIDSSEDGKSTTFNPTPVFVIDFGRNVTAKNPLKVCTACV